MRLRLWPRTKEAVGHRADRGADGVSRAQEEQLSVSGRNWGDAVVDKSSLVFRVDKKTAFNIAIPDVSQVRRVPGVR